MKYAPSLSDQINFHLSRHIWCETTIDNHYSMSFQHHHTSPAHISQLDLSLLAHHAANHGNNPTHSSLVRSTEATTQSPNIQHLTRKYCTCRSTSPSTLLRGKTQILALYRYPRYLSQQQFEMQHNVTPRQQGRSTSARFLTKEHQSDPIVQRENQNHGQSDKMPNTSTMEKSGPLHDTLHTIKIKKDTAVAAPKAKGQVPKTSAPTVRRNL